MNALVTIINSFKKRVATAETEMLQVLEYPLTEPQLEIWLSDRLSDEASCAFNESFTLHMRGQVDESFLKDSVRYLVNRHEALRAIFIDENHMQKCASKLDLEIPVIDLTSLGAADREAHWKEIIRDAARIPFRLVEGPMVRASLVKMEAGDTRLVFTAHQIVCDHWSTNVLLDELPQIYNAFHCGETATLSSVLGVPTSFASYARAQREVLDGPEGAELERFWLEQFRHPAPLLDLPTDRPRPAIKEHTGATYRAKIGAETLSAIKNLGARQKCTLFVILFSGFQILLSRLSGQEDIVVGVPTAGQAMAEEQGLVGHCVNFILLRGRLSEVTAAQFLKQIKETVLAGYDHQNYSYGRLVRKLQIPRDRSRLPLTEVQFSLERFGSEKRFEGLEAEADPNPKSFVNFDIFLNVLESENGLTLDCDYNTGLFDESTIARWLRYYETLLLGMVDNLDQTVSRLPLLDEAECRQLAIDFNQTAADYPRQLCVHQLFEAQTKKTPEAIAVEFETERLSYRDLDLRANWLAGYLRSIGVKPGVLVGVFVERSLEMIIALLGVMKAGGAYVPMDPTYPAERISFVLNDARVAVLLTQERLYKAANISAGNPVFLEGEWANIARHMSDVPCGTPGADDLAYVIYTSGSTGRPKGVEISHRSFVNLLLSMTKAPGLKARDTFLAVTTLSFDIAGLELFLPLAVGAKLVIANRESAADGNILLRRIVSSGATVMQATPVTWKLLIEAGWEGKPALKALCGGEAFPRDLANELAGRSSSVWNMYGPTETTIWSSALQVKAGDGPVPIGPPIDNTQFYVLDSNGQLAPVGVAGELYIGGDGLARGYFRRPELTAEKFVADPFRAGSNARLYRTGDLVRRASDGTIEFLGRLDHQVKLRGFRIELGEIEAALARYPGVRELVVIVREDIPDDKRLVAYIVMASASLKPAAEELRQYLKPKLPPYMLPGAYVMLEKLPLTPNGKVDRRGLPAPEQTSIRVEPTYAAPRTSVEEVLAGIWSEVLKVRRIGIRDDFFELGGHSLLAARIMYRIEQLFGKRLPLALLLQTPTIEGLSAVLRRDGLAPAWSSLVPIQPNGSRQPFFCVHGMGGNVVGLQALSRHLGSDQPFYGLQAQGLDGEHRCLTRVEDMASHYIREIRAVDPHGPYFLGGLSFGGWVALEMAIQLQAKGEPVEFVALLDSNPGHLRPLRSSLLDVMLSPTKPKIIYQLPEATRMWIKRKIAFRSLPQTLKDVQSACLTAEQNYKLRPFSGRITLFRASTTPLRASQDPQEEWRQFAGGGLEVHNVAGYHADIVAEPHVRSLAEKLASCLRRAQACASASENNFLAMESHPAVEENIVASA